jgi:hypothetical protein
MIIKNGKTISSVMKGSQVIDKICKGTLVVYEGLEELIKNGVPPLTLTKSGGKGLVDYKLYGNSVQKVDTSNIWDGTYTTGSYYDDTGNIVNNNSISMTDLMKLKYNKYDITSVITYDTYNFRYNFFDENKNWLSQILVRVTTTTPVITTIDVPEGARYINFSVFTTQMTSGQKICANEQAIPTIEFVGDKTKNLLNKNTSQRGYVNTSGTVVFTEGYECYVSEKIYVNPSTSYVYSGMGDVAGKTVGRTGYQYDENDNPITPLPTSWGETKKFTTAENCTYVVLIYRTEAETPMLEESETETDYEPYGYKIPVIARGKNIFNKNAKEITQGGYDSHYITIPTDTGIRIEFKATNTNTGVYLVKKFIIGKVSDFVGRFIRYKFDYSSPGNAGRFLLYTANEKGATKTYLSGYTTIENGTNVSKNSSTITQAMADDTDYPYIVAMFYAVNGTGYEEGEWKEYSNISMCSSKYTNKYEPYVEPITTNIYLDEPLTINDYIHYKKQVISKNGLEETIELPSIPTVKGTCILEVDTGVQPSNMEVIYKGKGE